MVLDTARPKYKENTIWPGWMRGRDAVRKSTPKVNILQVFTIDFSEIQLIVNHNLLSDGHKEMDVLAKEDHTYNLTPEEKTKIQRTMVSTLNKSDKNGSMKLRSDCRAAVIMKNRLHHKSGEPMEEPIINSTQTNTTRTKKFSPKTTSPAP